MGKHTYLYAESDTDDASSIDTDRNKTTKISAASIKQFVRGKFHSPSKSEPEEPQYRQTRTRSSPRVRYTLPSILRKYEKESSEESDMEPPPVVAPKGKRSIMDRYLVGRVPRPNGSKPGRGGGVAIYVRKELDNYQSASSASNTKKRRKSALRRLKRKRSY